MSTKKVTARKPYDNMTKAQLVVLVKRLERQVAKLEPAVMVCAEAYQCVGSMLGDLGQFNSEVGEKLLDNLDAARLVHKDVIPWPSFPQQPELISTICESDDVVDGPDTVSELHPAPATFTDDKPITSDFALESAVPASQRMPWETALPNGFDGGEDGK